MKQEDVRVSIVLFLACCLPMFDFVCFCVRGACVVRGCGDQMASRKSGWNGPRHGAARSGARASSIMVVDVAPCCSIKCLNGEQLTKGLPGSTQFLRNWFMKTRIVPNILVFIQFLETGFSVS
jgi:hypothetical protein